jgi:hypothetical protein
MSPKNILLKNNGLKEKFLLAPDLLEDKSLRKNEAAKSESMKMNSVTSFLFGAVEKIVIHCAATRDEELIRDRIRPDFSDSVPVSIQPSMLGMEYVQVHYSAGLLRPAHADVMVIS